MNFHIYFKNTFQNIYLHINMSPIFDFSKIDNVTDEVENLNIFNNETPQDEYVNSSSNEDNDNSSIDGDEIHDEFQDELVIYIDKLEEIDIKNLLDFIFKKGKLDIIYEKEFPKENLTQIEKIKQIIYYNLGKNVNIYSFILTLVTLFSLKRSGNPISTDISLYMDIYNMFLKDKKINDSIFILPENTEKKIIHENVIVNDNILKNNKKINPLYNNNLNILDIYICNISNTINFNKIKTDWIMLRKDIYIRRKKNIKFYNNIKNFYSYCNDYKSDIKKLLNEIDDLEDELHEIIKIERVLPIYDKLKENNLMEFNPDGGNELQLLFKKLDKEKINEYSTMKYIGEKIINENLDNNKIKSLLNGHKKDRLNRIITKCKRISILSKYIDISNIALSGISHFLRDIQEDIFNDLINLFKMETLKLNSVINLLNNIDVILKI